MKINIILDDFQIAFADLIDKEKFVILATSNANEWVIQKVEKSPETEVIGNIIKK